MLEFLPPYIYIYIYTHGGLHKERELIWQLQGQQPSHPFWGPHERGSDFFFWVGKVCKIYIDDTISKRQRL